MFEEKTEEVFDSFDQMNIKEDLLRGIYSYGYEKPSDLQMIAIVPMISQKDCLIQSPSGTGKTSSYIISMLERIDTSNNSIQGLILVPTRELAYNINSLVKGLGEYINVQSICITGGSKISDDIENLKKGPQIVVGTPGRIYDFLGKGILQSANIKMIVLDEVERLFDLGFQEILLELFGFIANCPQVCCIGYNIPIEFLDISAKFMNNPKTISIRKEEKTLEGIKQFYVTTEKEKEKLEVLLDLNKEISEKQWIIFVNSRKKLDYLTTQLTNSGISVSFIHGNNTLDETKEQWKNFSSKKSQYLIITDLYSRLIRDQLINYYVINYDIPKNYDNYIQRIGRSGCFGRKGIAINFILKDEMNDLKSIEKYFNTYIDELPLDILDLL